ncbi:hypothetical protein EDD72_10858 [Tepidibacillus fermentans]|uniref:Uncharacterized protein n=1 Tax=Tepidibacillus fermentans TaxID=1281767 RepID=A0A4R3KGV1_9BACI|nr:hypothetical protein EDD72_10858 [Tepidibacillus fermentans]
MKRNYKIIFLYVIGIILTITALFQAIDKNYLAFFPLVCAIIFFIRAWRIK